LNPPSATHYGGAHVFYHQERVLKRFRWLKQNRQFGDEWIGAGRIVALLVPSAAIRGEWNVLLNPAHAEFSKVMFHQPESFDFNARMFR